MFAALGNARAQSVDFGSENRQKLGFCPSNLLVARKLFQEIPRRVAKFRENRPRDVENLVDGKK